MSRPRGRSRRPVDELRRPQLRGLREGLRVTGATPEDLEAFRRVRQHFPLRSELAEPVQQPLRLAVEQLLDGAFDVLAFEVARPGASAVPPSTLVDVMKRGVRLLEMPTRLYAASSGQQLPTGKVPLSAPALLQEVRPTPPFAMPSSWSSLWRSPTICSPLSTTHRAAPAGPAAAGFVTRVAEAAGSFVAMLQRWLARRKRRRRTDHEIPMPCRSTPRSATRHREISARCRRWRVQARAAPITHAIRIVPLEIGIDCPHHRGSQPGNVGVVGERILFGRIGQVTELDEDGWYRGRLEHDKLACAGRCLTILVVPFSSSTSSSASLTDLLLVSRWARSSSTSEARSS